MSRRSHSVATNKDVFGSKVLQSLQTRPLLSRQRWERGAQRALAICGAERCSAGAAVYSLLELLRIERPRGSRANHSGPIASALRRLLETLEEPLCRPYAG